MVRIFGILVATVLVVAVVTQDAQARRFRRGGCPGGVCSLRAANPATAEASPSDQGADDTTSEAPQVVESEQTAETTRTARRLLGRRRR